jgi:hypothetical protein
MTAVEIETLVHRREEMPDGLNIAEISYFTTLENMRYSNASKLEKSKRYQIAKTAFEDCQHWIAIYQDTCKMRVNLAGLSRDMVVNGCPICKRAIAIFDGREKGGKETSGNYESQHSVA